MQDCKADLVAILIASFVWLFNRILKFVYKTKKMIFKGIGSNMYYTLKMFYRLGICIDSHINNPI